MGLFGDPELKVRGGAGREGGGEPAGGKGGGRQQGREMRRGGATGGVPPTPVDDPLPPTCSHKQWCGRGHFLAARDHGGGGVRG